MILCITHSKDYYTIDLVLQTLQNKGYNTVRFNTDEFDYSSNFCINSNDTAVFKHHNCDVLDPSKVRAVWNRKIWRPTPPADLCNEYQKIYLQEYITMRQIFFSKMKDVYWMNPLKTDREVADNKMYQLQMAKASGMVVPDTLMTNDFEAVKTFYIDKCHGQMIAKLHGVLSNSMDGKGPAMPTTKIIEDDFEHLKDSLKYCPMIFQPMIKKQFDLRVVYVEGEIFCGKIDTGEKNIDWRQQSIADYKWEKYNLPKKIGIQLTDTMKSMKLKFGAIDIVVDNEENYVFLEVNPQGEWGMIQKYTDQPIAETIAKKIINNI